MSGTTDEVLAVRAYARFARHSVWGVVMGLERAGFARGDHSIRLEVACQYLWMHPRRKIWKK